MQAWFDSVATPVWDRNDRVIFFRKNASGSSTHNNLLELAHSSHTVPDGSATAINTAMTVFLDVDDELEAYLFIEQTCTAGGNNDYCALRFNAVLITAA